MSKNELNNRKFIFFSERYIKQKQSVEYTKLEILELKGSFMIF